MICFHPSPSCLLHQKWSIGHYMQGWINILKSFNIIHNINRLTNKNHMILSVIAEKKYLKKIQHLLRIKTPIKLVEVNFLILIKKEKSTRKETTAKTTLHDENAFLLRL